VVEFMTSWRIGDRLGSPIEAHQHGVAHPYLP
jgi:hypothetical protein